MKLLSLEVAASSVGSTWRRQCLAPLVMSFVIKQWPFFSCIHASFMVHCKSSIRGKEVTEAAVFGGCSKLG
jgi:hypothetical protein